MEAAVATRKRRRLQYSLRTWLLFTLLLGVLLSIIAQFTLREFERRSMYVQSYPVIDVLDWERHASGVQPDFAALKAAIERDVKPETWKAAGGMGRIIQIESNLSLIVTQSPQVHQELADYLERRPRGTRRNAKSADASVESR